MTIDEWFEAPSSEPRRCRPYEDKIVEFAARHGRPTWPVTRVLPTDVARKFANKRT